MSAQTHNPAGQHDRKLLWSPTESDIESSRMYEFARWVEERHGLTLPDYPSLHRWSVESLGQFWQDIVDYFDVITSAEADQSLVEDIMPGARWFPGTRLNYAENTLRSARTRPDEAAIIGEHEFSASTEMSWAELEAKTGSLAHRLRELGVEPGDTVAAVLPNIPETAVALLATASVGAIWTVVNTDFGPQAVADRFAQLEPKVLFTANGLEFGGQLRDLTGSIPELRSVLPTVEHVIVVDQAVAADAGELPHDAWVLSEILSHTAEPEYEQVPFEHPLWVLYSSGTTGTPKGIVHSHGGVLIEFLKVLGLHAGLGQDDRAYFAVATTWMVWNLHIGILLTGATIITYDGSPTTGGPDKSLQLVAKNQATFFGTGAGILTMAERSGVVPKERYDLSALKNIMVTASPLPASTWDWVYDSVSNDVRLGSDSGGTDITSALIGTNPFQSVYRGELMGPCLGVQAEAWSPEGERVWDELGELVVTRPMPSMPIFFWNDPDGSRLHDAYFEMFPGIWRQGDWVTQFSAGSFVIHGRSDSTINRGGIRMGSADITHVVDGVDGVAASMVIGAELDDGDYFMPLFVVPESGTTLSPELKDRIIAAIRSEISPRYVPDEIIEAPAVPRTRTGKLLEVPIKKLFQGAAPDTLNRSAVEAPEVLDWYSENARQLLADRNWGNS